MPLVTTPMSSQASGISFLVSKFGNDVGPLKQIREILVNAFEAIEHYQLSNASDASYKPRVAVYADRWYEHTDGVQKMAYADNGIGMNLYELRQYFNSLAQSGKTQALDKNYGVGAKISTAAWNPYGVEIRSWKDGQATMVRLVCDENSGLYGLEAFEDVDEDTKPDYLDLTGSPDTNLLKPDFIKDHGTVVVLLGKSLSDNTMVAPQSAAITSPTWWFYQQVNRQFFEIPSGIKLSAWVNDLVKTRELRGYKPALQDLQQSSGCVELSNAWAHWWILDHDRILEKYDAYRLTYHAFSGSKQFGHIAALFRGELYDFSSHMAAIPALQKFGIFAGFNDVVLYLEPKPGLAIQANLTRTSLLMPDGTGLPWAAWASEFYANLPDEIIAHVERNQNLNNKDEKQRIRERIKQYKDFLTVTQRRPSPNGEVNSSDEPTVAPGTTGDVTTKSKTYTGTNRPSTAPRRSEQLAKETGKTPAQDAITKFEPNWDWVSGKEEGFENRAARLIPVHNRLRINQDFSVFREFVEYGMKLIHPKYEAAARPLIEAQARELYATQLIWTVISAFASFNNRTGWNSDEFAKLVSEEALTAAVLPRVYLLNDLQRKIKSVPTLRHYLRDTTMEMEAGV
jgi:hypothetical protein